MGTLSQNKPNPGRHRGGPKGNTHVNYNQPWETYRGGPKGYKHVNYNKPTQLPIHTRMHAGTYPLNGWMAGKARER